jgi:riboflavin kinase/FMN adenylyltransferase
MHLAHQQLFSKLDTNGAIVVIQTTYANLSPKRIREDYTHLPIFFYPLEDIKHLSGNEFIQLLHQEFPKLKKIVVGYDFNFGHKAASNTDDLKTLFNGIVEVVQEYKIDGVSVHSRLIRSYLREGKIEDANLLLGYSYKLKGHCIKGQGLGSKQFVPTINLDIIDFLIPCEGVYITTTIISSMKYKSVTFIGHRVSTDGKFAVETHILEDISHIEIPKFIQIEFFSKIRSNKKFDTSEDLKQMILQDIQIGNEYKRKL